MKTEQMKMAQLAGFSILAMALVAGLGYGYAFTSLYKANDSMSINQSDSLLRLTIVSFTIIMMLDIIVAWSLYEVFKLFNKSLSLITALFRWAYAAVLGVAICFLLAGLEVLKNSPQDLVAMTFQLNLFLSTWSLGLIIFGGHLFLLGILILNSGLFPKGVAYVTCFAGGCYFFVHGLEFVFPSYLFYKDTVENILALPMALGELILAVWLVRFGLKKTIN